MPSNFATHSSIHDLHFPLLSCFSSFVARRTCVTRSPCPCQSVNVPGSVTHSAGLRNPIDHVQVHLRIPIWHIIFHITRAPGLFFFDEDSVFDSLGNIMSLPSHAMFCTFSSNPFSFLNWLANCSDHFVTVYNPNILPQSSQEG